MSERHIYPKQCESIFLYYNITYIHIVIWLRIFDYSHLSKDDHVTLDIQYFIFNLGYDQYSLNLCHMLYFFYIYIFPLHKFACFCSRHYAWTNWILINLPPPYLISMYICIMHERQQQMFSLNFCYRSTIDEPLYIAGDS